MEKEKNIMHRLLIAPHNRYTELMAHSTEQNVVGLG
jgi:hypothetical protein